MAEKSGFFNALKIEGEYDRTYNANDYCDSLAVIISNGVLRSSADDLKVTTNGMVANVSTGWGWIKGHYYHNDSELSMPIPTAPAGGSRYDRIMLRFNNNIQYRKISLTYVQGIAGNQPVAPDPIRTDMIHDLVLADIYITANAHNVTVTDQRANPDLCGWVYSTTGDKSFFQSLDNSFMEWFHGAKNTLSSVTLFKRYKWQQTLIAETSTVQFNVPQYDSETCFVETYVNGILNTRYTLNNDVITFASMLVAGTVVSVNVYKSIDGTGIKSVADEITELQNQMAQVLGDSKFTYKCTGFNDNISLSQIATAFCVGSYMSTDCTAAAAAFLSALGGNAYLGNLYSSAQVTISVVGRLGMSAAFSGAGTETSPYRWIATSSLSADTDRKIVFDFARCEMITTTCANNTYNSIFAGRQINIKNANVQIYSEETACNITMCECIGNVINKVNVDDCHLEINASGDVKIAEHGIYTNCYCYIVSTTGTAYCFKPKTETFIRLNGGTYFAYKSTSPKSLTAIMHTSASETDAVIMAFNIHCPVIAKTNYEQGLLAVAMAGNTYINGVVSGLLSSGSYHQIIGQIDI